MMEALYRLEAEGAANVTLLGIGPMSKTLIRAAVSLAKEMDFPIMFIASRNQIDSDQYGRGYVCNWNQNDFLRNVTDIKKAAGFDGPCFLCRDHGGPWQRDEERAGKLPSGHAMAIAKDSFREDILAGFDLLHVDPTKDPHAAGVVPMDTVLNRTAELIEYAEAERLRLKFPPVAYEVGTEETNGGLTDESAYGQFIERLAGMLAAKNLPMPVFIVGQTGTLTRLTENVGRFDAAAARRLSAEARKYGVGIKEHNADYLSETILCMHPALGVTAANVAPEFGVAETAAYLLLAETEGRFADLGEIKQPSETREAIRTAAVLSERWRKWMVNGADAQVESVLADAALSEQIMRISGHYTFEDKNVACEIQKMKDNLKSAGVDAETEVINYIKRCLRRYADCFNLAGLNGKIIETLKRINKP